MSKVEPHFDSILDLVADGWPIERALKSHAEFPGKATFKSFAYDARHPERRERLQKAQAKGGNRKSATFGLRASEADYDKALTLIAADPSVPLAEIKFGALPAYGTMLARAKSDATFAIRLAQAMRGRKHGGKEAVYQQKHFDAALDLIRSVGLDAYDEQRAAAMPSDVGLRMQRRMQASIGLPGPAHLWKRSLNDAAFAERYVAAQAAFWTRKREVRDHAREQVRKAAVRPPLGEVLRASLLSNDLYGAVDRAVSRRIDSSLRDDVISDIVEAVLCGEITEDEIASRCSEFFAGHNRQFANQKSISLTSLTFEDGVSIIDRVSRNHEEVWGA